MAIKIFYAGLRPSFSLRPCCVCVCVNFMHKWWDNYERQIFFAILFSLRVFARRLQRGSSRWNIFSYFFLLFRRLIWGLIHGLLSCKWTPRLIRYGNLIWSLFISEIYLWFLRFVSNKIEIFRSVGWEWSGKCSRLSQTSRYHGCKENAPDHLLSQLLQNSRLSS